MSLKVKLGDQMPSIGLRATDGYLLNLRSYVERRPSVHLFFGAPTLSGKARERGDELSDALKDGMRRLEAAGVGIFAITCDSEEQQREYVAERQLPYLLLSDERRSAVEALGLPTTRKGENYNAVPTAFAVDINGVIVEIVEKATPRGLIARLLEGFREPDTDQPAAAAS